MVRVLLLQHLVSRFCVDTCTVSARDVFWRELPCCNWRRVVACGLNNDRVVTLKLNQKSTASTFAKETQKVTPDLVDNVAKTDWILPDAREGLTKPDLRSFFLRGLAPGSWLVEAPYDGPEVFLVVDAIHDGFHFGPGTYCTDGSKLYPDPRRPEVGWGFCSVTADLPLRTGAYGPVTLENATVPVAELHAVIFLFERSIGPIHIHSDCKYVRADKNKLTQRTKRGAHVTLWTRLQQALSRHQGTVEIFQCKAQITADNFHQFAMTLEILVGNVVADALAKKGASVIPAIWGKMDRMTWAVQQRIYPTSILAAQAAPRNTTAHPEDVLLAARRVRKRERTSLENASSHSLVSFGTGYHCHVCELSTPARGASDWLRNTICSGPPNSHPAMPVRIEHQTHQVSFTEAYTGVPYVGKSLSMRQARHPERLGWSMNALGI